MLCLSLYIHITNKAKYDIVILSILYLISIIEVSFWVSERFFSVGIGLNNAFAVIAVVSSQLLSISQSLANQWEGNN